VLKPRPVRKVQQQAKPVEAETKIPSQKEFGLSNPAKAARNISSQKTETPPVKAEPEVEEVVLRRPVRRVPPAEAVQKAPPQTQKVKKASVISGGEKKPEFKEALRRPVREVPPVDAVQVALPQTKKVKASVASRGKEIKERVPELKEEAEPVEALRRPVRRVPPVEAVQEALPQTQKVKASVVSRGEDIKETVPELKESPKLKEMPEGIEALRRPVRKVPQPAPVVEAGKEGGAGGRFRPPTRPIPEAAASKADLGLR
jgi:hypothetical protein